MELFFAAVLLTYSINAYPDYQNSYAFPVFMPYMIPITDGEIQTSRAYLPPAAAPGTEVDSRDEFDTPAAADGENRTITQYLQSIYQEELENGQFSPGLDEQLIAVGLLYQRQGRHDEASDYLQRARQIIRINNGLDTIDQIPVIELMIESLLALGDIDEADQMQNYLFRIQRRFYQDDETGMQSVMGRYADWQFRAFNEYLHQKPPPFRVSLSMTGDGSGRRRDANQPRLLAMMKLHQARMAYAQAIRLLAMQGDYGNPELANLEKRLALTFYSQYQEGLYRNTVTGSRIKRIPYDIYRLGKDSYQRILLYRHTDPGSSVMDISSAILELGDWSLIFRKRRDARKYYQLAYQLLSDNGVPSDCIDEFLAPEIPLALPSSKADTVQCGSSQPSAAAETLHQGYIDVTFTLNDYGKSSDLAILGMSANTPADIEKSLRSYLRQSTFRPRFLDGEIASTGSVSLRYYYRL